MRAAARRDEGFVAVAPGEARSGGGCGHESVVERVRRAAGADGAGESGLSALIGTHALCTPPGTRSIAVALAGTVFFAVPLGEARGRVALYLLLTLLPFSLLVPGRRARARPLPARPAHRPRGDHGRARADRLVDGGRATGGAGASTRWRWRCWCSPRAYGVARSAATPRVRPAGVSLVGRERPAQRRRRRLRAAAAAADREPGLARLVGLSAGCCAWAAWCCWPPRCWRSGCRGTIDEVRGPRSSGASRYRLLARPPGVVQRPLAAAVALRAPGRPADDLPGVPAQAARAPPRSSWSTVLGAAVAGQLLGTGAGQPAARAP